jgi:hypothetical protein
MELKEPTELSKKHIKRRKLKEIPKRRMEDSGSLRCYQIGILVNPSEFRKIQENAERYHNGNMSEWIRMRSIYPCLDISVDMDNDNQK